MAVIKFDRRSFVAGSLAAATLPAFNKISQAADITAAAPRAIPTADILAWQDLEIGMFVHFAPNTFQDKEGDDLSTPLSAINPDIDTDNWARCAVNLGARYIVFVAKHAGGFCMWKPRPLLIPSATLRGKRAKAMCLPISPHRAASMGSAWAFIFSPRDDYFGANVGGVCKDASRQPAYNAMYRQQLTRGAHALRAHG